MIDYVKTLKKETSGTNEGFIKTPNHCIGSHICAKKEKT